MTTAEVAELLRIKPETLRYWRHVKRGPVGIKLGSLVRYEREDVLKFVAAGRDAERA